MSEPLVILLNKERWADKPLLAVKRKPAVLDATPRIQVGDFNIPLQIYFYGGDPGATTLTTVRKQGVSIMFMAKRERTETSPVLFNVSSPLFTELTDSRGDWFYEADLTINTDELKALMADGADKTVKCDVVCGEDDSLQFDIPIRAQVYFGNEADSTPALEGLLADILEAANAAVAAVAGKQDTSEKDQPNGYAGLDADGRIAGTAMPEAVPGPIAFADVVLVPDAPAGADSSDAVNVKTLRAYAAKRAVAPLLALPGEAADGADIRLDRAWGQGGVSLIGAARSANGMGYNTYVPTGSYPTFDFTLIPQTSVASDAWQLYAFGATSSTQYEVGLYFGATGNVRLRTRYNFNGQLDDIDTGVPVADVIGKPGSYIFTHKPPIIPGDLSARLDLYINGKKVVADYTFQQTPIVLIRVFGGVSGNGQFAGKATSFQYFNDAVSADEALSLARGAVPTRIVAKAVVADLANGYFFNAGFDSFSYTSSTGVISVTQGAANQGCSLVSDGFVPALYRVTGNITTNTIGAQIDRRKTDGSSGNAFTFPASGAFETTMDLRTSDDVMGIRGTTGAAGTFSGTVVFTRIGTVEAYDAGNVTSLGRWIGRYGNDLLPVAGDGVTPVAPQPNQYRSTAFRVDTTAPTITKSPSPLYTLAKSSTGVVTLTPHTSIAPALPVAVASSEGSGYTVQSATNQSTGVITLTNRNGGTATDGVIQGVATHLE